MTLYFSPKQYRNLINVGFLPKPTKAQIKTAQKHNRELAQRLAQTINLDKRSENAKEESHVQTN